MGGVAVAIYVAAGQVEVHNEHGRTELAPGEMAVASEHASPRSEPAPIVAAVMPVRAKRKTISPREREEVKRRLEDALAKRRAPVGESDPPENGGRVVVTYPFVFEPATE